MKQVKLLSPTVAHHPHSLEGECWAIVLLPAPNIAVESSSAWAILLGGIATVVLPYPYTAEPDTLLKIRNRTPWKDWLRFGFVFI
jgi:hypothetical protein